MFKISALLFGLRLYRVRDYAARDRVMTIYVPLMLISLSPVWLMLVLTDYIGMYWALETCRCRKRLSSAARRC